MNATTKTNIFKSGNSVAIRLPKVLGYKLGDEVELIKRGAHVEIHLRNDPEKERADLAELGRILRELEQRKNPVLREPVEFPDRPGLY